MLQSDVQKRVRRAAAFVRDALHGRFQSDEWSKEEEDVLIKDLNQNISKAWDTAMNDPYPDPEATLEYVYSNNKSGNQ